MTTDTQKIRKKLRALAVDDSNLMLKLVSDSLKRLELEKVFSTNSPEEALDELKSKANTEDYYHILFLDWKMPDMDGMEILNYCRQDGRFNDLAIVMLTAENEQNKVLETVMAGATYYINKPASLNDLSDGLNNVISWFQEKQIEIK
jgi:two-component system chemotaxis response regulator CheY